MIWYSKREVMINDKYFRATYQKIKYRLLHSTWRRYCICTSAQVQKRSFIFHDRFHFRYGFPDEWWTSEIFDRNNRLELHARIHTYNTRYNQQYRAIPLMDEQKWKKFSPFQETRCSIQHLKVKTDRWKQNDDNEQKPLSLAHIGRYKVRMLKNISISAIRITLFILRSIAEGGKYKRCNWYLGIVYSFNLFGINMDEVAFLIKLVLRHSSGIACATFIIFISPTAAFVRIFCRNFFILLMKFFTTFEEILFKELTDIKNYSEVTETRLWKIRPVRFILNYERKKMWNES